eukprot:TRINITY_DN24142_c0_g1_i2.p1 TRINITY_DN24142_c0_g1~~TRINITY_DN24142_c0_g1_i2.p1  ORF type:complete len:220 (-),score=-22.42 TRINITY_DN24142_c0_g1_i2:303-962(-)
MVLNTHILFKHSKKLSYRQVQNACVRYFIYQQYTNMRKQLVLTDLLFFSPQRYPLDPCYQVTIITGKKEKPIYYKLQYTRNNPYEYVRYQQIQIVQGENLLETTHKIKYQLSLRTRGPFLVVFTILYKCMHQLFFIQETLLMNAKQYRLTQLNKQLGHTYGYHYIQLQYLLITIIYTYFWRLSYMSVNGYLMLELLVLLPHPSQPRQKRKHALLKLLHY